MKKFIQYRLQIGAGILAIGVLGFPIVATASTEVTPRLLIGPAFFGLSGLGVMIYDLTKRFQWLRGDFYNLKKDRISELREAVSEAKSIKSDVLGTIEQKADSMAETTDENVNRFRNSAEAFTNAVDRIDELISEAEDRMVPADQMELIDEAVRGFEDRDEDKIIDAIEALAKERK